MIVAETGRLRLRRLNLEDAPFVLVLVNEPSWLQFIGDKGVRNIEDARNYVIDGPLMMYEKFGFGLFLVERREDGLPIGMCGLLKRDTLQDVDIGYAFLPQFTGQGYALESATATVSMGRDSFDLQRIVAIVSPGNDNSVRLLRKLDFRLEKRMRMADRGDEVDLFALEVC